MILTRGLHRRCLFAFIALLTPLGIATKFYAGPWSQFVRSYLGGVLYVTFWILLFLLFRPRLPARTAVLTVLAITCALEFLQLWHPPVLQAIRSTFLGHALIGSTFSWWDLPCYAVGAVLAWPLLRICRRS